MTLVTFSRSETRPVIEGIKTLSDGAKLKPLQRNNAWLSLRLNKNYRQLLVNRKSKLQGPYICMTHN
jgi:hypothetical protein